MPKTPPAPGSAKPTGGSNALELTFKFRNDTKGAVRYEEEVAQGDTAKVGSLYIRKTANVSADRVKMTIQPL